MSVTAPTGFVAAGMASGIKANGALDLALVATDDGQPVPTAAVFTLNKAAAAPVQVSRFNLATSGGRCAAVILNSGNANAATGRDGRTVSEASCTLVAEQLGCSGVEVLVCSTGLIGIPLPLEPIQSSIPELVAALTPDGGGQAAQAIMTTDTHAKEVAVEGDGFTVGGIAKGAAMLAPNMATMLAVLTTDAAVDAPALKRALDHAVAASFNRLSIDGCTSTNDTVIVLASGRAGPPHAGSFDRALSDACSDLARQMAGDAEGATKVVNVTVAGAVRPEEAERAARAIADSQLVKCSWYGQDPYWGRIVSEIGAADVHFDPDRVSVSYGGIEVCRAGVAVDHDAEALAQHMAGRHLEVVADLGLGSESATILTNDLTHAYVDENMGTS